MIFLHTSFLAICLNFFRKFRKIEMKIKEEGMTIERAEKLRHLQKLKKVGKFRLFSISFELYLDYKANISQFSISVNF